MEFIPWVRAIRKGNESAFEEFFDKYRDSTHSYGLWLTNGDTHLSDELLQHTMIQAARRFPNIDSPEGLSAWLKRVMRNRLCDLLRKQKKDPLALLTNALELTSRPNPIPEPSYQAQLVSRALQTLSTEEQSLIEKAYGQRKPHIEIAKELESSPKAVESRLARIRKKLKITLVQLMCDEN